MRRLDWQLVRPKRDGDIREPLRMVEALRRLVAREAAGDLPDEDRPILLELEDTYDRTTVSACEAVDAPLVEDDADWESRIIDEYAESDTDLELEDYLEMRRSEPDCERCPYASPYSLYPMDPCEFSAGALDGVLVDAPLRGQAHEPMDPEAMRDFADALDAALAQGRYKPSDAVDAEDYLAKAVYFLRFWAERGFGVLPTDVDEVLEFSPEGAAPEEEDDEPQTYH